VVWVSSGALSFRNAGRFFDGVSDTKPSHTNIVFEGCSFGKYGAVVDFVSESPRVGSYFARKIHDVAESFQKSGRPPISTSLFLGQKVLVSSHQGRDKLDEPLKAYLFLNPTAIEPIRSSVKAIHAYVKRNADLDLCWNNSAFSFLVTLKGVSFYDMFSKVVALRKEINGPVSTSTFFALRWDSENQAFYRDKPKKIHGKTKKIPAIVYVKLRVAGERALGSKLLINSKDWCKMFSCRVQQLRRPGWLDECLCLEMNRAYDIMNAVCDLREDNEDVIAHSSTILLHPVEDDKNTKK
jgi:hypothetical protein